MKKKNLFTNIFKIIGVIYLTLLLDLILNSLFSLFHIYNIFFFQGRISITLFIGIILAFIIIYYIGYINKETKIFLLESNEELLNVFWPDRKSTIKKTYYVIIICLFLSLCLGFFDFFFNFLISG